jgi:hypothetical protein
MDRVRVMDRAAPSTLSTTKDDCFDDAAGGLHAKRMALPTEAAQENDFKHRC